jgi:hypothetical protein
LQIEGQIRTVKKASKWGALTYWRVHGKEWVRTALESKLVRGTHILESTDRGQIRTSKASEQVRGTHRLKNIEKDASQDK